MTTVRNKPGNSRLPMAFATLATITLALSATDTGSWATPDLFAAPRPGNGGLVVAESANGHSCSTGNSSLGAGQCPAINKLGGDLEMVPGKAVTTRIRLANTGSINVSTLSFTPEAPCTQSVINHRTSGTAGDLCARIRITITSGANRLFTGTADALGKRHGTPVTVPGALRPGTATTVTFSATLDPSADNAYQGVGAALPIQWTFAP